MRNNLGQYTNKKTGKVGSLLKAIYCLIALLAVIFMITYRKDANVPSTAPVVTASYTQEIDTVDPRVVEYLKSEEARLQAELYVYEKDRLESIETNKKNMAEIEATYQASLKTEKERHAREMLKVNGNLDGVRKQILGKPSLK